MLRYWRSSWSFEKAKRGEERLHEREGKLSKKVSAEEVLVTTWAIVILHNINDSQNWSITQEYWINNKKNRSGFTKCNFHLEDKTVTSAATAVRHCFNSKFTLWVVWKSRYTWLWTEFTLLILNSYCLEINMGY